MRGRGNCDDSAVAGSFTTRESMRRAVSKCIEVDYNPAKRNCANGYIGLTVFEVKIAAWTSVRYS